ncbi:hypothetical protein [Chryseobacterium sp. CT-SW4]
MLEAASAGGTKTNDPPSVNGAAISAKFEVYYPPLSSTSPNA